VADPRPGVSQSDLQKQFDLSSQIAQSITQLHTAVNQIRKLRADMNDVRKRIGDSPKTKPVLEAMDNLEKKMGPIEAELIQVKLKSSEGNLRYPNMLNEEFDTLSHTVDGADNAPTEPELKVYQDLNAKLQKQLELWRAVMSEDVPALNQLIQRSDIPAVNIATAE
jgi:seryl-tRNA synthetase